MMSSYLILTALLSLLVAIAYIYVKNVYSYWKRKGVPYIESSFPFGNIKRIILQKESFSDGLQKIYENSVEPFVGIYTLLRPMLLIRDPKMIQNIFIKDFANFQTRVFSNDPKDDPMADNIFLQPADKWKHARSSLSPAFTSGKLKGMFETIANCTNSLSQFVEQYADQNKSVEMRDAFARFATNVIASVGFGIEIDCIKDRDSMFREYGKRFFEPTFINAVRTTLSVFSPFLSRLFGLRFVDKDVGDFMIDTVKKNLEYREKNNIQRKDIFQLLMQLKNTGKIADDDDWSSKATNDKQSVSLEEISAHAFLFFVGGYESTSTTMSFCLYELAKNQEIQQRAYEDIVSALDKHHGQLTYDSVADMRYVESCIKETFRMHSPFNLLGRECTLDYKLPDSDIFIEKGTSVLVSVSGLHYDSQFYEEPEKFNPERFDNGPSGYGVSPDMPLLTFGDGPRNCVGLRLGKLQSKIGIVALLQRFRFELDEQHLNKDLEFEIQSISKTPTNGINLRVISRS